MPRALELPTIQNWSCHNCGGCCRQHAIEITPVEKQRILDQQWADADGTPAGERAFVELGRGRFRLATSDDGACVFLNEKGLCRIHAKFGEAAKPLACRIYPYAFHPGGDGKLTLGLRFSCPSVVANKGQPIVDLRRELTDLAKLVVPDSAEKVDPPAISGTQTLDWKDTLRLVNALRRTVAGNPNDGDVSSAQEPNSLSPRTRGERAGEKGEPQTASPLQSTSGETPLADQGVLSSPPAPLPSPLPTGTRGEGTGTGRSLATRLVHALFVTKMLGQASFEKVRGSRIDELTGVLAQAAPLETVQNADDLPEPSNLAHMQFRLIVAQYARHDTFSESSSGLFYRLSMVFAGARFTRGKGDTPALREGLRSVPFAALDEAGTGVPAGADELLARYFDVKLGSLHFAGRAFYDVSLVDGFANLALVYSLTLYVARWFALSAGRTQTTLPDVERALTIVDHPHGYSPALKLSNFRRRVRWLADNDEIARLIGWYGKSRPRMDTNLHESEGKEISPQMGSDEHR